MGNRVTGLMPVKGCTALSIYDKLRQARGGRGLILILYVEHLKTSDDIFLTDFDSKFDFWRQPRGVKWCTYLPYIKPYVLTVMFVVD